MMPPQGNPAGGAASSGIPQNRAPRPGEREDDQGAEPGFFHGS
jgi:hypothetical protein